MLLSSIWKRLFVKILIYHIVMVIATKKPISVMIIIKLFTWPTNLFQSYGSTMFNRYYKFHKDYKSFQSFIEYIYII
jgi:hypothetical protein